MVNQSNPHLRASAPAAVPATAASDTSTVALVLSWLGVGLPLAWGVLETLRKALALFE